MGLFTLLTNRIHEVWLKCVKQYPSDKTNLAMTSTHIVLVAYGVEQTYQEQCALKLSFIVLLPLIMTDCSKYVLSCSNLQDKQGNHVKGSQILPGVLKGSSDSTGQVCMLHMPLLLFVVLTPCVV